MFWKIIFYIYIGISLLTLLLFGLMIAECTIKAKKKYPDAKYEKSPLISLFASYLRSLLIAILPLVHIIPLFGMIFKWEDISEDIMQGIEAKIVKKKDL